MTLLTSVLALSLAAGGPAAAPSAPAPRPANAVAAPTQETGRPWVAVLSLAVLGGAALFLHRRKQRQPQTGRLELLERLSLGPRRALLRVRFGESELLLASTESGVQCLTAPPAMPVVPGMAPPAPRLEVSAPPVAPVAPSAPVTPPPTSQTESLLASLFEQAAEKPAPEPAPKPFEMAPPADAPRISLGQPPVSQLPVSQLPMAPLQRVVVRGVPSFEAALHEAALHEAASTEDAELRSKLSRAGRRSAR